MAAPDSPRPEAQPQAQPIDVRTADRIARSECAAMLASALGWDAQRPGDWTWSALLDEVRKVRAALDATEAIEAACADALAKALGWAPDSNVRWDHLLNEVRGHRGVISSMSRDVERLRDEVAEADIKAINAAASARTDLDAAEARARGWAENYGDLRARLCEALGMPNGRGDEDINVLFNEQCDIATALGLPSKTRGASIVKWVKALKEEGERLRSELAQRDEMITSMGRDIERLLNGRHAVAEALGFSGEHSFATIVEAINNLRRNDERLQGEIAHRDAELTKKAQEVENLEREIAAFSPVPVPVARSVVSDRQAVDYLFGKIHETVAKLRELDTPRAPDEALPDDF